MSTLSETVVYAIIPPTSDAPPSTESPPVLPALFIRLRSMLGRNKEVLLLLLLLRSILRGKIEIMNLSFDNTKDAGSNLPLGPTLNTLMPTKKCSGIRMRSNADLKLLVLGEGFELGLLADEAALARKGRAIDELNMISGIVLMPPVHQHRRHSDCWIILLGCVHFKMRLDLMCTI